MRQWELSDIIANENALVSGLLAAVFAEVPEIMAEAIRAGNETGESYLRATGTRSFSGSYDFQKYVDAALEDLQRQAALAADEFATRLQAEVQKLQDQDIADDAIIAKLNEQDWKRENRGRISSRLWSGVTNAVVGTASRIYNIAAAAIRFGIEVGV